VAKRNFAEVPPNRLHWYAGLDAASTLALYRHQREAGGQFLGTWRTLHQPALSALRHVERWGALLSEDRVRAYDAFLRQRIERARDELAAHPEVPRDLNTKSAPQMQKLLFETLGLRPVARTKGGAPSASSEALEELEGIYPQVGALPLIRLLASSRAMLDMYGANYLKHVAHDGLVHTRYRVVRSGRLACVAAGTPVEVLRDVRARPAGVPIEEVRAGDWAYCYDDQLRLALRRVVASRRTGHRAVVRVHWAGQWRRSEGHVDLTPEHRVRKVDGSWVRADDLRPGDRVLSLSRGVSSWGYARLYPTRQPEITREHRFVWAQIHARDPLPEHVHHEDGNPLNNVPGNLLGMTSSAHASEHGRRASPELRARRAGFLAAHRAANPEAHLRHLALAREACRLNLGPTEVTRALEENGWSVTKAARACGRDFATFKAYVAAAGLDLRMLRQLAKPERWSERKRANHPRRYRTGYNHEVLRVEDLPGEVDVYDLEVEGEHNFIAGGVCVHNSRDPNLQNLKKPDDDIEDEVDDLGVWARACWVVPEGHVLLELDYAQHELRTACLLSGDEAMAAAFASGHDFHRATAARTFGVDPGDVNDTQRRVAKVINFRTVFGGSDWGLARMLRIPEEQAEEYTRAYFAAYPQLARYLRAVVARAGETGDAWTRWDPEGWVARRPVPEVALEGGGAAEKLRKHAERVCKNNGIQWLANAFALSSLARVVSWVLDQDVPARVCMTVHDALYLYVRRDAVRDVAAECARMMVDYDTGICPLRVDAKVGEEDLGHMEKLPLAA
jgi:DNA polymerase I-like protein with 3'-5' exonuclease and polymerase domains